MHVHAPDPLPKKPPLIVALHGCGQSPADYDRGSGWTTLANRLGCVVVYPKQQPANNPNTCFSWFQPDDIARNGGEALSIHQMVEHALSAYGADRRKVFVTGLSAGGAMAAVMLATYPEVFAGGAIIAGLPYGCAGSVQEAFEAMFKEQSPSTRALGDRVRAASRHQGPWPRISVWHGSADPIVKPSNAEHIVRQWVNVHGLPAEHTHEETIGSHTRRVWTAADGSTAIEAYAISGMAHGVPLALSMGAEECGAAGPFFLDAGISSTHHIAHFWGLAKKLPVAQQIRASSTRSEPSDTRPLHDPNPAIAAAFKAAGLPEPKLPAGPRFDPGPIIEAALKAAGLRR